MPGWGRVLAERREDRAGKLGKIFPKHHTHKRSKKELFPTVMNITKPYPLQGTSHSDMVKLAFKQQEKNLKNLAHFKGQDSLFMQDLALIEDKDAGVKEREAAEERVMAAYLEYGECIGHGDQMTVAMWQDVMQLMAQEVTAHGRLQYASGPFRLEGMHMKMRKIIIDYRAMMPSTVNFSDILCMAELASRTDQTKISNKEEHIKRNDSSFERHDQFIAEVSSAYGVNAFDNYDQMYPERLDEVSDLATATQYMIDMMDEFGILENLFYNPALHDPTQMMQSEEAHDDCYVYCRAGFIR